MKILCFSCFEICLSFGAWSDWGPCDFNLINYVFLSWISKVITNKIGEEFNLKIGIKDDDNNNVQLGSM